jgi:raffinose/stachyose/melibiose transport system permease protein
LTIDPPDGEADMTYRSEPQLSSGLQRQQWVASLPQNGTRRAVVPATLRAALPKLVLLTPACVLLLIFVFYPAMRAVWDSFFAFGLDRSGRLFVGLRNYELMLSDPVIRQSLSNNMIILVSSVAVQVGGGLVLAALIDQGIRRGKAFYQIVIFLPVIISSTAVGLLWQMIYDPNVGLLNAVISWAGVVPPSAGWLGDPHLAIWAVAMVANWTHTGLMMVMLLAGMQAIPQELYQAARLDRASSAVAFLHVTVPGVRNVIIACVLFTMIGALKTFDTVYVLTHGGPGNASQVLAGDMVQNAFFLGNMGYASAIAVLIILIALPLGLLQMRVSRSPA